MARITYWKAWRYLTTGNNVGTSTPGLFQAVTGYDLCTGLGTPKGTNLGKALAPLPDTTPLITGIAPGAGSVILGLSGVSNYTYVLEGTTNLVLPGSWQPVTTNIIGANNVRQFTDMLATNFTQRFYRLELAPRFDLADD